MSDKKVIADTPGIILTRIFRTLIFQLGVSIERYQYFMSNFIRQLNLNNNYKVSSLINNITKEVFAPTISWKVFIKALLFLGVNKLDLYIQINPKSETIMYTIDLSDESMISNLFSFITVDEVQEEFNIGIHLKKFLELIIVKNSYNIKYSEVVNYYLEKLKESNKEPSRSLKGNLIKELKLDSITWKVFIKAFIIYGITEPIIGVTIYDKMSKKHSVSFNISLDDTMLQ